MTREEWNTLADWFKAGTAEKQVYEDWRPLELLHGFDALRDIEFSSYRERKPKPTLPDEIWLPDYGNSLPFRQASCVYSSREHCMNSNHSATPIRYVRADRVIDGSRILSRVQGGNGFWYDNDNKEFRIKP